MNSAEYSEGHGRWLAAIPIGLWAAAIAVAPSFTAKALLAAPAVLVPLTWWTLHKPARWVVLFFAAAWLLPPLPVRLGDSGPHVCLFFAALGLFSGLLWLPRWRIAPTTLTAAFIALFGAMLASVALAAIHSGAPAAAGSLARVALFGIPVYIFFFTAYGPDAKEGLSHVRLLFWIAAASALIACIDFHFQFPAPAGYGPQFVSLDSGVYRRAQGVFYEASTLGNFCAFFLVMIAVAWSRPRAEAPVGRKALAAGGFVFFGALVLSYSRGSAMNVLVALAVLAWLNRRRIRLWRAAPILTAGVGAAAFATWKVFPAFAQMYWLRLSAAQNLFSATERVLSGRVASWRMLASWMAANPWQTLIGVGYKTLPYNDYLGAPVVADNMYLSLLVETGIAGLAAFLWLNVAILRAAARASRASSSRTSFFGAWMLCFWAGQMVQMLSGDLFTYWRVLPVYFWVLALAVRV